MKNFKLTAILLSVILLVGCNQSIDNNVIIDENELTPIVLKDLPNIDSNMYVYFSSLNEIEKTVYKELYIGFTNHIDTFSISTDDAEMLFKCYSGLLLEHPEIFYIDGYSYSKEDCLVITPNYTMSINTARTYLQKCDNYANRVVANISEDASDYEKVITVYDYLASHTIYSNCANDQNMVSVATENKSVCLGYSLMYQYILQRLGISNIVVTGTSLDTNHAWNIVKVNNEWYHSDVTWASQTYSIYKSKYSKEEIPHDYFLLSDADISKDHTMNMSLYVPSCISNDMNYYVLNNILINEFSIQQLKSIFSNALLNGDDTITIKCDDYNTFVKISDYLIGQDKIFDLIENKEYSYVYNIDLYTLTFWF